MCCCMLRWVAPIAFMSRHVSASTRITGRINEKVRTGHPAADLAFLQHALWGLDHYPDYLRRWQDEDVGALEGALEAALAKVRAQRADARQECDAMASTHPKALDALRGDWRVEDVVCPKVATALGWHRGASMAHVLKRPPTAIVRGFWGLLREPEDDVYALDLLRPEFCAAVVAASDAAAAEVRGGHPRPQANLDVLGVGWLADLLLLVTEQVAACAWPRETGDAAGARAPLDWRHAYVLRYAPTGRSSLVPHTDDSEVTVNVGLGERDAFEGGDLLLGGVRGTPDESEDVTITPDLGVAVFHLGRRLHAVDTVTDGERRVLICWCRAMGGVRSRVCPCCWMNRRDGGEARDCVCGDAWNS